MAVYIDPPRWPAHGTHFSHMVSDHSYAELHEFARALEISPKAFDEDHYDVPEELYGKAREIGAVAVSGSELIRILRSSGLRVPGKERAPRLVEPLRIEWERLFPDRIPLGERLIAAWSEPHRHYHTVVHLHEVLRNIELLSVGMRATEELKSVKLAAWFHDAVYNGQPVRDEQLSAEWPQIELEACLGVEVARLVTLTINHQVDDGDWTGKVLVDADLGILASEPQRYGRYLHQVRQEYKHVSDEQWAVGRGRVLEGFLRRNQIYQTNVAVQQWELRARENLEIERKRLE